jgi:Fe-S-cluster containining protein
MTEPSTMRCNRASLCKLDMCMHHETHEEMVDGECDKGPCKAFGNLDAKCNIYNHKPRASK